MKERLTGAVILVALVVLLVPELLTGPVRSSQPAAAPEESPEAPLRSYTIDLAERPTTPTPTPAATSPASRGERATAEQPAREESSVAIPADDDGADAPADRPAAASGASTSATPDGQGAPAPQAVSRARERAPDASAARTGAAAPAAAPPVTGWTVQVGSFVSRQNAQRLTQDLKRQGFAAFLAEGTSGGRKVYRVRVGPVADRAAAQQLATKLRAAGRNIAIVAQP